MNKLCPSCGTENTPASDFCYQCDAPLEAAHQEDPAKMRADSATLVAMDNIPYPPPAEEPVPPPKIDPLPQPQKAAPKRRKWLLYTLGCLGLLIVFVVGLSLAHLFLLRPVIQREAFQLLEKEVRNSVEIKQYQGRIGNSIIEQGKIEDMLDEVWDQVPGLKKGKFQLQQDKVILSATVYGINFQVAADVRCDSDGNLLIKTFEINRSLRLLFVEKDLEKFIQEVVNDEIIDEANIALKALQVTEEGIFITYEGR